MSNEQRRVTIYINGKEVADSIKAIRSEARKLRNELANTTRGTAEYERKLKELKKADAIIADHNAKIRGTSGVWGNLKKEVKQFGAMAIAYLGAGQLLSGIDNLLQRSGKLDDKFADVRKTTGLTIEEVKKLNDALGKLDTRSSRNELLGLAEIAGKLGLTGSKEIEGFVESADKINVALSKDLGGDIEETVRQLGTLTDLFGETHRWGVGEALNKTGSAINELGAASKAREKDIVDFTNTMGSIAPQANVGMADIMGLGATISNLSIETNVASTVMSQVLPQMFTDTAKYAEIAGMKLEDFQKILGEDSNEAFVLFLEGIQKNKGGLKEIGNNMDKLGLNGKKAIQVLGALSNQTETLREQQILANESYESGASLIEEFNIKNATLGAVLEKLQKAIRKAFVNTQVTESIKQMAFWVYENLDKLVLWGRRLVKITAIFASFKATILAVNNAQRIARAISNAYKDATVALALAKSLLAQRTKTATGAVKLFNIAMKSNILGIFLGLLTAVATAYFTFKKGADQATEAQEEFNEAQLEGQRILNSQTKLEDRYKTINKLSKQQLKFLLQDIEMEIEANEKKDAATIASAEKNKDKILKVEQDKIRHLQKLEKDYLTAKDGYDAQQIRIQIESIKAQLSAKETIVRGEEGITQKEVTENKKRLTAMQEVVAERIKNYKKGNDDRLDDDKRTNQAIFNEAQKLNEELLALEEKRRIKDSQDPELEAIKAKWNKKVKEYTKQFGIFSDEVKRIEKLRDQELNDYRKQRDSEEVERYQEYLEKMQELTQEMAELNLTEEENDVLNNEELSLVEQQQRLIEIRKEYALKALAIEEERRLKSIVGLHNEEKLKAQTIRLYARKREQIEKKAEKDKKDQKAEKEKITKEEADQMVAIAGQMIGEIAGMMNKGSAEWKAMKIAEATISTYMGVAKAMEAGPILAGPLAAMALVAGMGNVMQIIKTEIPKASEQYFEGGYNMVQGPIDGKTYKAKKRYDMKGGVVTEPSLVLGGEAGTEYWVNNDMLQIPAVADVTNAMELLRTKQISVPNFENIISTIKIREQYVSGGYSNKAPQYTTSTTTPPSQKQETDNEMKILLEKLNNHLENPKESTAIFDFDYFEKTMEKIDRIRKNARG